MRLVLLGFDFAPFRQQVFDAVQLCLPRAHITSWSHDHHLLSCTHDMCTTWSPCEQVRCFILPPSMLTQMWLWSCANDKRNYNLNPVLTQMWHMTTETWQNPNLDPMLTQTLRRDIWHQQKPASSCLIHVDQPLRLGTSERSLMSGAALASYREHI